MNTIITHVRKTLKETATDHGSEEGVELVDPGQAEVGELDDTVTRDEQVLRLEIAMHDAMAVKEVDAAQDLPDDVLRKTM
jgi:hypothetical protein